jgi:NADPH:quinone reductase-like Zn-dependent oxidoreductase
MFSRKTRTRKAPTVTDERMEAVVIHRFGDAGVLEYTRTDRPEPRLHDVVLRVRAIGINPLDWKTREGRGLWDDRRRLPAVLGWDVSGTVVAKGRRVTEFEEGDEVFGLADFPDGGAYAEFVRAPMDQLVKKPAGVDHAHAAAVPVAGLAAYQALFDLGRVGEGRRVLIHGAAGGVGHIAVQLASSRGAHVIGTASVRNLEFIRALGADEAIDYAATPFERSITGVDLVVDTVGGEVTERSLDVLARHGVVVSLAAASRSPGIGAHRVRLLRLRADQYQLQRIAQLLESGELRTSITTVPGLHGIRDAHRISETGHVRGKVVVTL